MPQVVREDLDLLRFLFHTPGGGGGDPTVEGYGRFVCVGSRDFPQLDGILLFAAVGKRKERESDEILHGGDVGGGDNLFGFLCSGISKKSTELDVGNASRAKTVFRLALLLYSFVEDTFTQERGSKKGYLLFFLYFSSGFIYLFIILDLNLHHRVDILLTGYEPGAVTAPTKRTSHRTSNYFSASQHRHTLSRQK